MSERRPFPPSPRRLALARRAGLHAASPVAVGAVAAGAGVVVTALLARSALQLLGGSVAAACAGRATLAPEGVATAVLSLVAPLVGVVALVAAVVHVAQTRALWLPRRTLPDAPALAPARGTRWALDVAGALAIGGTIVGWLFLVAPKLAILVDLTGRPLLVAGASLIAAALVSLVIAWLVTGIVDALVRRAQLAHALAMTPAEKRQDDRLAAADPRWRAQRAALARMPSIAEAVVLVLGDGDAVAIAWDPVRRPIPARLAVGKGPRATQLLGLARRHGIAVHRDVDLARALVGAEGPVPERHWARLAQIVAAVRR
jgi:flagellar biosynthesis protein FlhB